MRHQVLDLPVSLFNPSTIRRWRKGLEVEGWKAHDFPIQTVKKLQSGELVTGSDDATLKLWKGRACQDTFTGHKDAVRDVAVTPECGIVSASDDCCIMLWTLAGQEGRKMIGHSACVYSVDIHSSGLVASGSKDCILKIWRDGNCLQSIEHPGCVWDVKFLENGDVLSACADGIVRIWISRFRKKTGLDLKEVRGKQIPKVPEKGSSNSVSFNPARSKDASDSYSLDPARSEFTDHALSDPKGCEGHPDQDSAGCNSIPTTFQRRFQDTRQNLVQNKINKKKARQVRAALKDKIEARKKFLMRLPDEEVKNICLSVTLEAMKAACSDAKEFNDMLAKARTFYGNEKRFYCRRCIICDPDVQMKSYPFWSSYFKKEYLDTKSYIKHVFYAHLRDPDVTPSTSESDEVLLLLANYIYDDNTEDPVHLYFSEVITDLICGSPKNENIPSVASLSEWIYGISYSEEAIFFKESRGYLSFLVLAVQITKLYQLNEFLELNLQDFNSLLQEATQICKKALSASTSDYRTAFLPVVQYYLRVQVEILMKKKATAAADELLKEELEEKASATAKKSRKKKVKKNNRKEDKVKNQKKNKSQEEATAAPDELLEELTEEEREFLESLGWDGGETEFLSEEEITSAFAANPLLKKAVNKSR